MMQSLLPGADLEMIGASPDGELGAQMFGKDGFDNAPARIGAIEQAFGAADPFQAMPASPSKPAG